MNQENNIRAAWWDRKEKKYDYGCWHNRSNLPILRQWIGLQNDLYPTVFYWVEENNDNKVTNLIDLHLLMGFIEETYIWDFYISCFKTASEKLNNMGQNTINVVIMLLSQLF